MVSAQKKKQSGWNSFKDRKSNMGVHITKTFNAITMPQMGSDVPSSVKSAMQQIVNDRNNLASLLNGMKNEIMQGSANSSNVTINIGGIAGTGGGSSGGGSGTTIQLRANSVSLTANVATPVTFSSPFTSTFVISQIRTYDSGGAFVGVDITSITANGFTATSIADCTLEYIAAEVS